MYSVNFPSDPERYCLRLLLLHVPLATSFEDLRTLDGTKFTSVQEAAKPKGLTEDKTVWEKTLDDAIICSLPRQLRELFAYICFFAVPSNVSELFDKYKEHLLEDIIRRHEGHNDNFTLSVNLALREINNTMILHG